MCVCQERFQKITDAHLTDFFQRLHTLKTPVVLVPMGEVGLQALTGQKGLTNWRGSILSYAWNRDQHVKVIPMLDPALTFKSPSLEKRCRYDIIRIAGDAKFPELRLPERCLHIQPNLGDVRDLLAAVQRSPTGILAVDIETPRTLKLVDKKTKLGKTRVQRIYGASRVTCVGFSLAPGEAISIPTTLEYWGNDRDLLEVWRLIRALCALPIAKALQNGLFDSFYLAGDHQVVLENFLYDTLDEHHAIDSTDEHSLAFIASTWTRQPYWKHSGKDGDDLDSNIGDLDEYWRYNCVDAAVTRELAPQLEAALREDGKWQLYLEHYPPLRAPLLSMMLTGIKRDVAATKQLADELKAKNASIRTELDAIVKAKLAEQRLLPSPEDVQDNLIVLASSAATQQRQTISVKAKTPKPPKQETSVFGPKSVSPKKLAWYLYDVLRIPKRTKKDKATGDRKVTTDEVALRTIAINYPAKVGAFMGDENKPGLLQFRRNDKVGSFLKEEVADADGYVRCSYRRATETHRLSSSKNPRRTGQNLQNVDRDVRRVYVPDPGTVFVECDLSQAEDRVVKAYTGDASLIAQARTLPHEFDVHTHNAAAIFQVNEKEVSKEQRYLGKKAVHASNYSMGGKRLSEELLKEGYVRTPAECQRMIDRRFEASPGILLWQQQTRMEVMRTRSLTNSWGWSMSFKYERLGDDVYRRAYAYRPQSDIGILTNLWGLVPLYNWILEQRQRHRTDAWRRTRLVLQVHDALVACCPPETAWPVASAMRFFLERPHAYGGVALTIPVDVSVNKSWAKDKALEWKRFPTQAQVEEVAYGLLKG